MLPSIADIVSRAANRAALVEVERLLAERVASAALCASARSVAALTAEAFGLAYDDVWQMLAELPPNALDLLATPQGWSVISQHVAMNMLDEPAFILPSVH